jgi:hypothetical protein
LLSSFLQIPSILHSLWEGLSILELGQWLEAEQGLDLLVQG